MIQPGTTLAHYEVVSALGKGGMGEVWRAKDTKLGREVAIKTLPPEFAEDADRLSRIKREAKLLASLNHPNIAAIYGIEEHEGSSFLVLELVEGDTLADRLERGAIPVEESLKLALQVAEALESAHEKGVIHRDLKPANIKITPDGRAKVLDFGLAKALLGDTADVNPSNSPTLSMAATQAGVILGTAAYMSPEQASGEVADHRADIWSFGVVLFEMLTGRPVFAGKTVAHVMGAVLNVDPPWVALPVNLHPRVRVLLERMLEKEPRNRLSGISDARMEIGHVLDEEPTGIVQASPVVAAISRRALLGWTAATIGIAAGTGLVTWNLRPEEDLEYLAIPTPGMRVGRSNPFFTLSPDGNMLAYGDTAGALRVRRLSGTGTEELVRTTNFEVHTPVFSPDGRSVAYVTQGPGIPIRYVPANGGASRTITEVERVGGMRGITWDGNETIFGINAPSPLRRARVAGDGSTEAEPLTTLGTGETAHRWPHLLPGGEAVLFTVSYDDAGRLPQIALKTLANDDPHEMLELVGTFPVYSETGHIIYASNDALWAVSFDTQRMQVTGESAILVVSGVRTSADSLVAHFAVANQSLAYIRDTPEAGERQILRVDPDGNEQVVPGGQGAGYGAVRYSPDGQRALVGTEPGANGLRQVWNLDFASGLPTPLDNIGIWTPNGMQIVYTRRAGNQIEVVSMNADGSGSETTLATLEESRDIFPAGWTRDGDLLATTTEGVGIIRLDGSATGFSPIYPTAQSPDLSPDGNWIAYYEVRRGIFVERFPEGGDKTPVAVEALRPYWAEHDAGRWSISYLRLGERSDPEAMARREVVGDPRSGERLRFGDETDLFPWTYRLADPNVSFDMTADGGEFLVISQGPDPEADHVELVRPLSRLLRDAGQ